MKAVKKKRAGFTLVESLMAIAILALFSVGAITVTTTVLSSKNSMQEVGEGQALANTAILTIADEIRYAQDVRFEDDELLFVSKSFGANARFTISSGKIVVESGSGSFELLPSKYYGSLAISALTFERITAEDGGKTNEIKISVAVSGGQGETFSTDMTVSVLNGVA